MSRSWRARPARGSPTSRAARTIAERSWPACIRRSCPGARVRGRRRADEVENLWGPIIVGDEGRNWWGILRGVPPTRDIDVLFLIGVDPLRDFPDAALATRALQNVGSRGRPVARAGHRSSRSPTRSSRRRRSWRRRGTSPRGKGATNGSGRSEARPASRSPTGRSSRAWRWRRRRPRVRDARRAPRGDGPAAGAARSTGPGARRERARARSRSREGSLHLFTYPLLVDEGRLSERSRRAEGGAGGRTVPGDPPERRGAARRDRRRRRHRAHRGRGGRAPGARDGARRRGGGVRAVQPAGIRRQHAAHRGRSRSPRGRAGRRAGTRVRDGRACERWMPDGLARLAPADRPGRRGVLRAADHGHALHLDGAQGHRRHAERGWARCAPGPRGS